MTGLLINDDTLVLQNIASTLTGKPLTHIEFVQITKYEKDGKFDYHYDTDPLLKHHTISSRIATLMFYLNEDFEGGNTNFPYIQTTVIPSTGKAVLFYNVLIGGRSLRGVCRSTRISQAVGRRFDIFAFITLKNNQNFNQHIKF
jgi:hypothetical protein